MFISNIDSIQIFLFIMSMHWMNARIIRLIIDSIIPERHQHPFIDCFCQRNLIRHIVVTNFIDVSTIHSLRCCCQSQQKLWFEIIHDSHILVIDRMMKLINYNIIKIIWYKIFCSQILRSSQRCYGSEYNRFIPCLFSTTEKSIVL